MTSFKLDYTLTRPELTTYRALILRRLKAVAANASIWQSSVVGALAFSLMIVALLGALIALSPRLLGQQLDLLAALVGMWFGILFVFVASWHRLRGFQSAMYRDDGPSLARQSGTVDEAGLRFDMPFARSHFEWPLIRDVTEHGALTALWIDNGQGFVIPARAFSSEAEAQDFVAFARTQVAKAAASQSA